MNSSLKALEIFYQLQKKIALMISFEIFVKGDNLVKV